MHVAAASWPPGRDQAIDQDPSRARLRGLGTVSSRSPVTMLRSASRRVVGVVPGAVWLGATVVLVPLVVAGAAYRGVLELVAVGVAGAAAIVFTMVNPRPMLFVYVALIPLEATLVIGEAATITRAVGAAFFVGYVLRRFGHLHLRAIPVIGWAYFAWALASYTWAISQIAAADALFTLAQLFAMTVVVADLVAEEPGAARRVLWVYVIAACATAVIALGAAGLGGGLGGERIGAFESQDVAQFAALVVPAVLFFYVELLEGRHRLVASAGIMVAAAAIVFSGTRSAWIAMAVAAAVITLPRIGRRGMVPIAMVGLGVLALFTVDELGGFVLDRLGTALSSGGAGRIDIWSVGLNIFAAHPVAGVGYGNFPIAFTPEVIRATDVPGLDVNVLFPGAGPHSFLIGTLAELGLVGIALLVPFLGVTLLGRATDQSWPVVQGILLALVVQGFFLDLMNRKHFWLFIGLALGLAWQAAMERRARAEAEAAERDAFAQTIRTTWAPS